MAHPERMRAKMKRLVMTKRLTQRVSASQPTEFASSSSGLWKRDRRAVVSFEVFELEASAPMVCLF